jgi:hypothetical protein
MKTFSEIVNCVLGSAIVISVELLAITPGIYGQTFSPVLEGAAESLTPAGWNLPAINPPETNDSGQPGMSEDSSAGQAGQSESSSRSDSIVNGPNDWVHRWLRGVDKARSEQPHYVAPLITTHVLLVEQFRFDSYYQSAHMGGAETQDYGAMHGLEIIPNTRMEVQVGIPPYFFHQAPNTPNGFGDVSIFLKLRVASAPEGEGGYFFGCFLGGEFPSGAAPNGMGHTIWTPMVAAAKRWGFFDWQINFGGTLPQSGTATLGRQIIFNNTFQFSIANKLWPEVENNTTFIVDGPNSGSTENFVTPGLLIGPFRIAERLHFEPGVGIQIATSQYYTYNHRWIWTVRFPF